MDTEFEEVVVDNFGPFIGKHKLKLNGTALTFVKGRNDVEPRLGSNGAGKSKLLNSIAWCLYGKTTDDLASTDIRPWGGKGQTAVTLKLTAWDGDEGTRHTIKRTAGPNSLTIDGKACSQDEVQQLVGMSLDVFRLATFLGQGQPLFHDLPNREKLDFLVGVLGLDRWDEYSDRAKRKADDTDRSLQRLEGEIAGAEVRGKELDVQLTRQKEEAAIWENERAGKLRDAEKVVAKLDKEVEKAANAHGKVAVKLDDAELKRKLTDADSRKFRDVAYKAELAWRQAHAHQLTVQRDHEAALVQLQALKESRTCPTCAQPIKRESKYLTNLEKVEGRVRDYATELNKTTVDALKKASDAARIKAEGIAKSAKEFYDSANALSDEETLLRRNKVEFELELKHAKKQRDSLEQGENPHRGRLAELRKALKSALDDARELGEQRTKLEQQLHHQRYWVKGFKDVRLYVLEDALVELEFATNAMLDSIGLIGWEVKYAVERETKSGTIQRGLITTVLSPRQNADVKWKSWSGGEGQRLRIAGALALSEVLLARAGVQTNLEVLDEPSRSLSVQGVDDLCDFLSDRARLLKKSIFLVDHMAIESTRFDRVVTVRKTKDGSTVSGGV